MPYHWQAWQDVLRQGINRPWSTTSGIRPRACATARSSRPALSRQPHAEHARTVDQSQRRTLPRTGIERGGIEPCCPAWPSGFNDLQAAGWKQADRFSAPRRKRRNHRCTCCTSTAPSGRDVSAADVQRGKPDPDIVSARRRSLERAVPQHCLVIEDAPAGIEGRAPGRHESDRGVELRIRSWKRMRRVNRCKTCVGDDRELDARCITTYDVHES